MQRSASHHGTPDPTWLAANLSRLGSITLLLVCGTVAKRTYDASGYAGKAPVIYMLHPAARTWTKDALERTAKEIHVQLSKHGRKSSPTICYGTLVT
jgi:hypothetical protein